MTKNTNRSEAAAASWPDEALAALVPAYRPPPALLPLVRALNDCGCRAIIVVDDGSGTDWEADFAVLSSVPGVEVLRHAVNQGKGAALKTGFGHILDRYPGIRGVVTMDADGQHRVADSLRVATALAGSPDAVVIGTRSFSGAVPWRSRFGNTITRFVFRLLYGRRFSDTQCGLRGFPAALLPWLMDIPTRKYDYELDVLIGVVSRQLPLIEQPIETVYLDDNRSSHFNPLLDSLRIYLTLFRFASRR